MNMTLILLPADICPERKIKSRIKQLKNWLSGTRNAVKLKLVNIT